MSGKGWEIGQDVYVPQVLERINHHAEVSYVENLDVKINDSAHSGGVHIEIKEYEMICAASPEKFKITIDCREIWHCTD